MRISVDMPTSRAAWSHAFRFLRLVDTAGFDEMTEVLTRMLRCCSTFSPPDSRKGGKQLAAE
jgi:hypothetical protein